MDFHSFSHGQMHSKIWLCENLEPYLKPKNRVIVVGCWHNLTGIMLNIRNPHHQFYIKGIDIDNEAIKVADKLTEAWRFEPFNPFNNEFADAATYDYTSYDVVINSSVEHMNDDWYKQIPFGKLVCIQSFNISIINDPIYKVINPNSSMEIFREKYPMTQVLYVGEKRFDYSENPYSRYCVIGYK